MGISPMAVSCEAGRSSALNPNAPLFIPMSFQQIEDFSPEWWKLVKTNPWFREYWSHQYQELDTFGGDENIDYMFPDFYDHVISEFTMVGPEFDDGTDYLEILEVMKTKRDKQLNPSRIKGFEGDAKALIGNLSLRSPKNGVRPLNVPGKYHEKYRSHQYQELETFGGDENIDNNIRHIYDQNTVNLIRDLYDLLIRISTMEGHDGTDHLENLKVEKAEFDERIKGLERYSRLFSMLKPILRSPKNGVRPLNVPGKYHEKPVQFVSPKCSPRRIIHQPR